MDRLLIVPARAPAKENSEATGDEVGTTRQVRVKPEEVILMSDLRAGHDKGDGGRETQSLDDSWEEGVKATSGHLVR